MGKFELSICSDTCLTCLGIWSLLTDSMAPPGGSTDSLETFFSTHRKSCPNEACIKLHAYQGDVFKGSKYFSVHVRKVGCLVFPDMPEYLRGGLAWRMQYCGPQGP